MLRPRSPRKCHYPLFAYPLFKRALKSDRRSEPMHVRQAEETNAKPEGLLPIPQGRINVCLLARLTSKGHMREHDLFALCLVCLGTHFFGIPGFCIHVLSDSIFQNSFFLDSFGIFFLSESISSGFMFGSWSSMRTSGSGRVSFHVETVKISESTFFCRSHPFGCFFSIHFSGDAVGRLGVLIGLLGF